MGSASGRIRSRRSSFGTFWSTTPNKKLARNSQVWVSQSKMSTDQIRKQDPVPCCLPVSSTLVRRQHLHSKISVRSRGQSRTPSPKQTCSTMSSFHGFRPYSYLLSSRLCPLFVSTPKNLISYQNEQIVQMPTGQLPGTARNFGVERPKRNWPSNLPRSLSTGLPLTPSSPSASPTLLLQLTTIALPSVPQI